MDIRWSQVNPPWSPGLLAYIKRYENYCVAVAELIHASRKQRSADHNCAVALADNAIHGMLCKTKRGILYPVWSPKDNADMIKSMIRFNFLFKRGANIYACAGPENNIAPLVQALREEYLQYSRNINTIVYSLLHMHKKDFSGKPIPQKHITIKQASVQDIKKLFPLQRAYLLEEVYLNQNQIHDANAIVDLHQTLKNHLCYYASVQGVAVAKVATNALGFNSAQIGGVYTMPQFRQRGIATHCLQYLLDKIYRRYQSATLFVKQSNTAAIHLYKQLGFSDLCDYQISYLHVGEQLHIK